MTVKVHTRVAQPPRRPVLTGREHEMRSSRSTAAKRGHVVESDLEHAAQVLGRVIFGGYFIYSGLRHFANRQMMIGYAKAKGVSWPKVAVLGTGAMLVVGGLSVLTGVKPKVGASLVTTFLAGVTPMMHDYWNVQDQGQRASEMVNFTKNLALIGGAALAAAVADGPRHHAA